MPRTDNPKIFTSERQMGAHFAERLDLFEPGLSIYSGDNVSGYEYPLYSTRTGCPPRIDLLAVDATGCLVIFEFKLGYARPYIAGQVAGYASFLSERDIARHRRVRVIIVCRRPAQLLWYALREVKDLNIKVYEYDDREHVRLIESPLQGRQLSLAI